MTRMRRNPWTESMKQALMGYSPDGAPVRLLGRRGLEGRIERQRGRTEGVVPGAVAEVFFRVVFDRPIPLQEYVNALGQYSTQNTLNLLAQVGALPPQAVIRMTTDEAEAVASEEAVAHGSYSLVRAKDANEVLRMGILITSIITHWRTLTIDLDRLQKMRFVEITSGKGDLHEKLIVVPARYVGPYNWESGKGWRFELIDPMRVGTWTKEFGPVTDATYAGFIDYLPESWAKEMKAVKLKLPPYTVGEYGEKTLAVFREPMPVAEFEAMLVKHVDRLRSTQASEGYWKRLAQAEFPVERARVVHNTLSQLIKFWYIGIRDVDLHHYAIRPLRDENARELVAEWTDTATGEFEIS